MCVKTWYVTSGKELAESVLEQHAEETILPKREVIVGAGESYIVISFVITECYEGDQVREDEMSGVFWFDCLVDCGLDRRTILKWILKKFDMRVWIGFVWLCIETSGRFQ
jgi:hypothetical protein